MIEVAKSDCEEYFGACKLAANTDLNEKCPVKECKQQSLGEVPYNKKHMRPYCNVHGVRLHPKAKEGGTFVYYNGNSKESNKRARLRNICFQKNFVKNHILDNPNKAETHRLGHETSEDALSWNVFVSLTDACLLLDTTMWLLGNKPIQGMPELYLWGSKINLKCDVLIPYEPLWCARKIFESDITYYKTEPDIMLIIPGELVMCIEAKFTSGNPLAPKKDESKEGEKPQSKKGILERYIGQWVGSQRYIEPNGINEGRFHTQLFRNIVFASWMAEKENIKNWHVVNLVSSTQWDKHKGETGKYDFECPTKAVRDYLKGDYKSHFTFRTWEGLYREIVYGNSKLGDLSEYLCQKTANLEPAFDFSKSVECQTK